MFHRRVHVLTAFALFLFAIQVSANDDPAQGLLDREALMAAAAECTPEAYPDSPSVVVDHYERIVYRPDGTSEAWDDSATKILTEQGRRSSQTLSFGFTLPFGTVEVKRVEVLKADGTVVEVDVEGQSRVMIDRSQMGSNIYNPNAKVMTVGVPNLEVGDTVRYVAVRHTVKARMPDTWATFTVFEWSYPIRRAVYEVHSPKELPLRRIALRNPIEGTVAYEKTEGDGGVVHRWTATNVPRMFDEPSMPTKYTVVQNLRLSTVPDWETISRWYWNLCIPHLEDTTPEMERTVAELIAGIDDRQKKIERVFYWVAREVRYMGITTEDEAPGYEPHPVRMTFEQRHGVCRDKGVLLVAMLRMAGFEAFPVLIHSGPKMDNEVPQTFFNHAIVAVREPGGTYQLMDPTSDTASRLFPTWLGNKSYLIATPDGETLKTSPVEPATDNLMTIRTTGAIDATGALQAETVLEFAGVNDAVYRGFLQRARPEQRHEFFEGVAQRAAAGARLTSLELTPADMNDTATPMRAVLRYRADDALVAGPRAALVPLPRLSRIMGMTNFIIGNTGLDTRRYPFETGMACGVDETISLDMSKAVGSPLSLPAFEPIDNDKLTWRQKVDFDGRQLDYSGQFLMKAIEFSPEEYLGLKEALKEIEYDLRKRPIFEPAPATGAAPAEPVGADADGGEGEEPDAVFLEDNVEYRLHDRHSWTTTHRVRKRIVTLAGRQKNADIRIDFNPAWENVEIVSATVTAPDGTTQHIQPEEINLMDAAWVASAPRYPGAKTLVASMPGVAIGSVIDYTVVRTATNRPFFADMQTLRQFDPVEKKTVTIDAPEGLGASAIHLNFDDLPEVTLAAGPNTRAFHRTWTAENAAPLKREPMLPPAWAFVPTVAISNGSWPDYAHAVHTALTEAAAGQPNAEERGRQLRAEGADAEHLIATLTAIRDVVARNIRAAGPGLADLPLSAITPADRTLADGYGNSADRAVLLYAMLKAAGCEPEFVLATSAPQVDALRGILERWPSTSWIGDVLVRVPCPVEAAGYVYLNDTNQYAALGSTPHDGRPGIALPSGQIETIAARRGYEAHTVTRFDLNMKADGSATITRTIEFHGAVFMAQNRRFSEMPAEELRRYHLEAVASISQAATPVGPLEIDFDSYPGSLTFTVEAPRYAVRDGARYYFTLPNFLAGMIALRSAERDLPLYWPQPTRRTIVTRITPPPGFESIEIAPALGEPLALDSPLGAIRIVTTGPAAGEPIVIVQEADLAPALVNVKDYDGLMNIVRTLTHPKTRTVLLKNPEAGQQ